MIKFIEFVPKKTFLAMYGLSESEKSKFALEHPVYVFFLLFRYACSFLANFVNVSRDHPPLNMIVNRHGEILFKNTMQCLGGDSGTYINF